MKGLDNQYALGCFQAIKNRLPGEIAAAAGRAGRWANQMSSVAHNGCCRRVAQEWVLHCAFWKLLVAEGLHKALLQLEMPLVGPLFSSILVKTLLVPLSFSL